MTDNANEPGPRPPLTIEGFDIEVLARFARGDSPLTERRLVREWLAEVPSRAAEFDRWRKVWELTGEFPRAMPGDRFDAAAGLTRIRERIGDPGQSSLALQTPMPGSRYSSWRIRRSDARAMVQRRHVAAAAAAALLVAAAVLVRRAPSARDGAVVREFSTIAGARANLTLGDGTQLVLGPASRLRVPVSFGHGERVIELDGEAFLRVVHDPAHPLSVRTPRMLVRDVGTTFVVHAYAGDVAEHVAVSEGRVEVTPTGGERTRVRPGPSNTLLGAGDVATVGDTASAVRHAGDVAIWTAWTQGGLAFEDAPLGDVAREIGRAFGVQITVADSALATKLVTARFNHQPLAFVLEAVTQTVGAHYEWRDRGAVIISGTAGAHGVGAPRRPLATAESNGGRE